MNAEDFYEHLKEAIRYFGLSFHQKDQIKVDIDCRQKQFIFAYKNMEVRINF